jgi:hypothetical protein
MQSVLSLARAHTHTHSWKIFLYHTVAVPKKQIKDAVEKVKQKMHSKKTNKSLGDATEGCLVAGGEDRTWA